MLNTQPVNMNHLLRQSHKTPMGERQNCWTDWIFYTALPKIYLTCHSRHRTQVQKGRSDTKEAIVQAECRQSADKVQTKCRQSADKHTLSNLLIISAVHTKSAKCKQNKIKRCVRPENTTFQFSFMLFTGP